MPIILTKLLNWCFPTLATTSWWLVFFLAVECERKYCLGNNCCPQSCNEPHQTARCPVPFLRLNKLSRVSITVCINVFFLQLDDRRKTWKCLSRPQLFKLGKLQHSNSRITRWVLWRKTSSLEHVQWQRWKWWPPSLLGKVPWPWNTLFQETNPFCYVPALPSAN